MQVQEEFINAGKQIQIAAHSSKSKSGMGQMIGKQHKHGKNQNTKTKEQSRVKKTEHMKNKGLLIHWYFHNTELILHNFSACVRVLIHGV